MKCGTALDLVVPPAVIHIEVTPLSTVVKKDGTVRKLYNRGSSFLTYIDESVPLTRVGHRIGVTGGKLLLRHPFDGPEEAVNLQEGTLRVDGVSHVSKVKGAVKLLQRVGLTSPQTTHIVLELRFLAGSRVKQLAPAPKGMKITINLDGTGLDLA